MNKSVAVIIGDGVGPELVAEGLRVVSCLGVNLDIKYFELGAQRFLKDGSLLDDETIEELKSFDAVFLGPIGHIDVDKGLIAAEFNLKLRVGLDLYINKRSFKNQEHDFAVIHENTEGSYSGIGGVENKETNLEVATQSGVNTYKGVKRVVEFGFEQALLRRKHVTLVHKTDILNFTGGLWQRVFDEVSNSYEDVVTDYNDIDIATSYLVSDAGRYDVIVTNDLFGDILSVLGGAVSNDSNFATTSHLHRGESRTSVFEMNVSTAADKVGQGVANPLPAIKTIANLLDFLGFSAESAKINGVLEDNYDDLSSTIEITDALIANLNK